MRLGVGGPCSEGCQFVEGLEGGGEGRTATLRMVIVVGLCRLEARLGDLRVVG